MGYLRTMGAGLAGSTTKLYGNANVNQIQYGDKLQGLPPVTGARRPYGIYRTRAGGGAADRQAAPSRQVPALWVGPEGAGARAAGLSWSLCGSVGSRAEKVFLCP